MKSAFETAREAYIDRQAEKHYSAADDLDALTERADEIAEEALRTLSAHDLIAGMQSAEMADAERLRAAYYDDKLLAAIVRELVTKSITDGATEKARQEFAAHH